MGGVGEVLGRYGRLETEGHQGGDGRSWAGIPATLGSDGRGHLGHWVELWKWGYLCVRSPILRAVHCSKKGRKMGGERRRWVLLGLLAPLLPGVPNWVRRRAGFGAPLLPTESILEHMRALLGFRFYKCSQRPRGVGGAGLQGSFPPTWTLEEHRVQPSRPVGV